MSTPETRYAKSGDVNVAYQVLGDGPLDLVMAWGWIQHLDFQWMNPTIARSIKPAAIRGPSSSRWYSGKVNCGQCSASSKSNSG